MKVLSMKIIIRLILIATIAIAHYIGFISQNWTLPIGISALCAIAIIATFKKHKANKNDKNSTVIIAASAASTWSSGGESGS